MMTGCVDERFIVSVHEIPKLMRNGFKMVRQLHSWYLVRREDEDKTNVEVIPIDWFYIWELRKEYHHTMTEHFIHMTLNNEPRRRI